MLDLLRTRRSIRKYTDTAIESWKIDVLKEALLRSFSGRGLQPWEFVFVDDTDLMGKLSGCKPSGSAFLEGAKLCIAVIADPEKTDIWIEDCSIAAAIAHMTCHSLDLGSCWIQIRNRGESHPDEASDNVKKILNIPENYVVEALIAVGYPGEEKEGTRKENLDWSKIHENSF
jgi:nitroreductase